MLLLLVAVAADLDWEVVVVQVVSELELHSKLLQVLHTQLQLVLEDLVQPLLVFEVLTG
jgi:hypothetical protein